MSDPVGEYALEEAIRVGRDLEKLNYHWFEEPFRDFELQKYAKLSAALKAPSEGSMKGELGYTTDKVVATDFRGESCTSVFDAEAGIALDDTFVKIISWYDTEWGYSSKVLEMVRVIAR